MSGRPPAERALVLCADDYGMNPGVNRAILDLAAMGRISATSCMTNAAGWPRAARDLAAVDGTVAVGLHLTLTWGRPLGPMPRLAPGGECPPLGRLLRAALTRRLDRGEIRAEIERQLEAFSGAMGRPPAFIDGHQHVHVLPGIRDAVLDAVRARGWAGRLWLRDPADRPGSILGRRKAAGKALFVGLLATGLRATAGCAGLAVNAGFSGFSSFDPTEEFGEEMGRFLTALGPRPVVMCHPGRPDGDGASDEIAAARPREYDYLASPTFPDLLASRGLRLAASPI